MQNATVKKQERVLCVLGVRTLSYLQRLIGDTHRSETACHRGGRYLEHQSHNECMGSDWLVVICCKSFSEFEKVTKQNTSNWSCWCWKISNAIIDAKCDRKETTTWRLLIWRQKKSTKITCNWCLCNTKPKQPQTLLKRNEKNRFCKKIRIWKGIRTQPSNINLLFYGETTLNGQVSDWLNS